MKTVTSSKIDNTPVAADIFTYCTREKMETWHVVMNHDARGTVDRVECKACKSQHKYRSKLASPSAKSSSATFVRKNGVLTAPAKPSAASTSSGSKALEETWFVGIKKWGDKAVADFNASQSYKVGEVFNHSVFGKGVVQARRENKVDVLVSTCLKTLPCANSQTA